MLNRTQQLHQGPGSTASLVEHVVDFQPGRCLAKLSAGRQRRAPHTGRQALRHGAKTGADIPYPAGEVVCTGVEVRLTALQAFDIAVERANTVAIFAFAGRHGPAVVVEMQPRLRLGQITVLGRLRLRTRHIAAQRTGHVTHLNQHAILPARHVIQPQTGRHDVVAQVATRLLKQGLHHSSQGAGGVFAIDHLGLRGTGNRLQIRLAAPVPAHQQADKEPDHNQCQHCAAYQ